jgi:hypothetical protein
MATYHGQNVITSKGNQNGVGKKQKYKIYNRFQILRDLEPTLIEQEAKILKNYEHKSCDLCKFYTGSEMRFQIQCEKGNKDLDDPSRSRICKYFVYHNITKCK